MASQVADVRAAAEWHGRTDRVVAGDPISAVVGQHVLAHLEPAERRREPDGQSIELLRTLTWRGTGVARYRVLASIDKGAAWPRDHVRVAPPSDGSTAYRLTAAAYHPGWQRCLAEAWIPIVVWMTVAGVSGAEADIAATIEREVAAIGQRWQPGLLSVEAMRLEGRWLGEHWCPAAVGDSYVIASRWESVVAYARAPSTAVVAPQPWLASGLVRHGHVQTYSIERRA